MADITELAQREKFEAWWECEYKPLESSKYTDAVPHIKYGFWMAFQAGGAELVEALEKAQKSNEFLKGQLSELANFNPDWDKLEASYESWREIAAELLVAKERIAELESRTVKLPAACADDEYFNDGVFQPMRYERDVERALRAAGIKWEAE
ncbi:MAG: hypothetical protein E6X94_17715 [Klebsiella michiganensis]|nr:hypothetical protein [Klebsiella michiganensis]